MSIFNSVSFSQSKGSMRGLLLLALTSMTTFTALEAYSAESGPLQASEKALGVAKLKSIEFSGTGHWYQFGQAPNPNTAWPQFDVSSYTAAID